jgi:hypothetical protein
MIYDYELYKKNLFAPMQILQLRKDGIHDICIQTCDIPFWSDSLTTDAMIIFAHQGIVTASLVEFPKKHFYITGYMEAVQNCIDRFAIGRIMHQMNFIWEKQANFVNKSPPAYPKDRSAIHPDDQESLV